MGTLHTQPTAPDPDDLQPDRAQADELGRTTGAKPAPDSPREQPAKAVHLDPEADSKAKRRPEP